jgi:hypothetical protein
LYMAYSFLVLLRPIRFYRLTTVHSVDDGQAHSPTEMAQFPKIIPNHLQENRA